MTGAQTAIKALRVVDVQAQGEGLQSQGPRLLRNRKSSHKTVWEGTEGRVLGPPCRILLRSN